MASISDPTQEFVKDQILFQPLEEEEIPEELVKEFFESLEDLDWEPSEEDLDELQEKIDGEWEEPQHEELISSSSEELFSEARE